MIELKISPSCQIKNLIEIYQRYFNKTNGFFVEVGAFDGESWSNTSGLADLGWQGIYIEPIYKHIEKCRVRHRNNNVAFEQFAISNKTGNGTIHLAGGLSTMNDNVHVAHKNIFGPEHFGNEIEIEIRTIRLDELLFKHTVPTNFDLLVVDVEGHEQQVFESFDLAQYRPKMIIAELSDVHHAFDNYLEIQNSHSTVRKYLINAGYKEVYVDAINTIFHYEQS